MGIKKGGQKIVYVSLLEFFFLPLPYFKIHTNLIVPFFGLGWVVSEILVSAQGPLVLVFWLMGLGVSVWGQGLTPYVT